MSVYLRKECPQTEGKGNTKTLTWEVAEGNVAGTE